MHLNARNITLFISIVSLLASSCKKDDDTTIPSLDGSLKIAGIETFISAHADGTEIVLRAGGDVSHPEGANVGYYWKVSPLMSKYDTTLFEDGRIKAGSEDGRTFRYRIKDTLGTFSIYCYAYANGYSGLSASGRTTTVRGGVEIPGSDVEVSITGTGIASKGTNLTGTDYYYTTLGEMDWIMNNLHETEIGDEEAGSGLWGYDAMSDVFGRYYSHEEALAICAGLPQGEGNSWRLPSDEDWMNAVKFLTKDNAAATAYINGLQAYSDIYWDTEGFGRPTLAAQLMVNADFNYLKLWEYWPGPGELTNISGISAIPAGYANLPAGEFSGVYDYAAFWTSSIDSGNPEMAYYRYMFAKDPHLMIGRGSRKDFGASVRCVRDSGN